MAFLRFHEKITQKTVTYIKVRKLLSTEASAGAMALLWDDLELILDRIGTIMDKAVSGKR